MHFAKNRVALYIGAAATLVAGLAPIVGNLNTKDTVSVLLAAGGILKLVSQFVAGCQHEDILAGKGR